MNTKKGVWCPVGSASTPSAYTALLDAAKAVVSLSLLPLSKVPEHVRIAGSNISFRDAAEAMTAVSGRSIQMEEIDLVSFKSRTTEKTEGDAASFIRFIMGEGKLDFTTQNENDIVNPEDYKWKWKTVHEYAKEVGGKPWIEYGD
jgi:hypothetical protein